MDSVEKFGLLVEILPGKTGLVHTSELDVDRTVSPESFNVGDRLDVKCLEVRLVSRCEPASHLTSQPCKQGVACEQAPTFTTHINGFNHVLNSQ